MSKYFFATVAFSLLTPALSVPLYAQEDAGQNGPEKLIVSAPKPSVSVWIDRVSVQLDDELARQPMRGRAAYLTGIVQVSFRPGPVGHSREVLIYRGSGNDQMDIAALRAVSRLDSMRPQPLAFESGQLFLANIIFASSDEQRLRLQRKLSLREDARIAAGEGLEFIALNPGLRTSG